MADKPYLGTDLKLIYSSEPGLYEDADMVVTNRLEKIASKYTGNEELKQQREKTDLSLVSDCDNIIQSLVNRLKTVKGELTPLGHPEYGSRHHEFIGKLNTKTHRSLVKLHILEALSHEPRIDKITRSTVKFFKENRSRIDVVLEILIVGISNPINLVVPFYFEPES